MIDFVNYFVAGVTDMVHGSTGELDRWVSDVRAFNRFYTDLIGVLNEGLLDTPYSLAEARVIFELAQQERLEVSELRSRLAIDPGYLSRILAKFDADGLIGRSRSRVDGRRQVVGLTHAGQAAFAVLDDRSAGTVRDLLTGLADTDRARLLSAMTTIREIVEGARPHICILRDVRPGDLGWVVQQHGALYAQEYGWDQRFEALVARIVADYVDDHDAERERGWIAEVGGEPAGSVFCVAQDDYTAQLRLLLVEPRARGLGIGAQLVDECVQFAKAAGYQQITLWTNDVLVDARRIYERAGFALVAEQPHDKFGPRVVGQHWLKDL